MKIHGASAVVTGGANGIGREITSALLEHGAKVYFLDVDVVQGRKTESELREKYDPIKVTFIECDVTKKEQLEDTLKEVSTRNGGINILCNNAGIMDNVEWHEMINVNLTALIRSTMIGLDLMNERNGGQGGVIVNIASMAGILPYPFSPVYAASKHGVVGFTRSIAPKAFEVGVRLNFVCPSFVNTRMTQGITETAWVEMIEKCGVVTAELVAKGFIQLIEDDSRNGEALRVTVQNGIDFHPFPEEYGPV